MHRRIFLIPCACQPVEHAFEQEQPPSTMSGSELRELDSFFRGANLYKGRLFLEASHMYDVREFVQADRLEITTKRVPRTRVNTLVRCVKIEAS